MVTFPVTFPPLPSPCLTLQDPRTLKTPLFSFISPPLPRPPPPLSSSLLHNCHSCSLPSLMLSLLLCLFIPHAVSNIRLVLSFPSMTNCHFTFCKNTCNISFNTDCSLKFNLQTTFCPLVELMQDFLFFPKFRKLFRVFLIIIMMDHATQQMLHEPNTLLK